MSTSSYAVGSKTYRGVSSAPNYGPVDQQGYAERDRKYKTRKKNTALLRRIQAKQKGRYISADYLSSPQNRTV